MELPWSIQWLWLGRLLGHPLHVLIQRHYSIKKDRKSAVFFRFIQLVLLFNDDLLGYHLTSDDTDEIQSSGQMAVVWANRPTTRAIKARSRVVFFIGGSFELMGQKYIFYVILQKFS